VTHADCDEKGYILFGFPQSKAQAVAGQKIGLLPRQVFTFLPDTREPDPEYEGERELEDENNENEGETETEIENEYHQGQDEGEMQKNSVMTITSAGDVARLAVPSGSSLGSGGSGGDDGGGGRKSLKKIKRTFSRSTIKNMSPEVYAVLLKDISSAFHADICKVIPFDPIFKTSRGDAELIGILMTWKPVGGPFVPRVVIMG
jgi:hypothetical protein